MNGFYRDLMAVINCANKEESKTTRRIDKIMSKFSQDLIDKAKNAGIIFVAETGKLPTYGDLAKLTKVSKENIAYGSVSDVQAAVDGTFSRPFKAILCAREEVPGMGFYNAALYEISVSWNDRFNECKILTQAVQPFWFENEYATMLSMANDVLAVYIVDEGFETRRASNEYPEIPAAFKGNIESKSSMDSSSMPVDQDQLENLYNIYNLVKDDDGMRKAFKRMIITAYPDKAETMLQLFRMNSKLLGKEAD